MKEREGGQERPDSRKAEVIFLDQYHQHYRRTGRKIIRNSVCDEGQGRSSQSRESQKIIYLNDVRVKRKARAEAERVWNQLDKWMFLKKVDSAWMAWKKEGESNAQDRGNGLVEAEAVELPILAPPVELDEASRREIGSGQARKTNIGGEEYWSSLHPLGNEYTDTYPDIAKNVRKMRTVSALMRYYAGKGTPPPASVLRALENF